MLEENDRLVAGERGGFLRELPFILARLSSPFLDPRGIQSQLE